MACVQETAINIGFACSLLRTDMTQYIISANVPEVVSLEDQGNHEQAFKVAHAAVQVSQGWLSPCLAWMPF